VHISPVKPQIGSTQQFCSPHSFSTGRAGRAFTRRILLAAVFACMSLALTMAAAPVSAQGQQAEAVSAGTPQTIYQIRVIGNRRIPKETILARLFTHVGDEYDPISIERDFNSLWNTSYFDDLRFEREDSEKGIILDIFVREKPNIREINYKGLSSVTVSDVLDRFKKEKVGLSVESQFNSAKIKRAETILKEMLAEHGHQFATIKEDIKTIPPASVQINFIIKEGPVVKVGRIKFQGNEHISSLDLRRSMRNLKPVGIPYSIVFENLFPRTFDSSKLEEDTERVRQAYRDKGYYAAAVEEPKTQIRDEGGLNWFTFRQRKGKRIDILMGIEEGSRYRLGTITFTGNKAVTNEKALRATFALKDGDWFNATLIGKGLENLKKAYGQLGYINFGAIPTPEFGADGKTVSLKIDIDEGKQFYVSRIEFQGNTVTRDRVIRRELLLDEGSVYNSQLWEYSLLRLNQLEYFETLKVETDSEAHQDPDAGTVELLLKVKEKGKNSIGMNGGVSGLSGAFLGINYQTNNFLGLGETLSLQGNIGNVSRQFLFGFTQPYIRNRAISLGFQIFNNKTDYNAAKNYQATTGVAANLTAAQQALVQNYNQTSNGFNASLSYPLKRHSFQRLGLTYSWTRSSISTFSPASQSYFQTLSFRSGIQGSNALSGILNSSVSLSYMYNTVSSTVRPRTGKEISAVFQMAGLWGNVRYIAPAVSYRSFRPMHYLTPSSSGRNILALRAQLSYVQGISGAVAPPENRFYSGGESDVRGFDIRGATPYGYVPTRVNFQLTNPDGTCVPRDPTNPQLNQCIEVPLPIYGIASIGGDTNLTTNVEYRIPIVGPLTFALFDDFGINIAARRSQLAQSPEGFASLLAPLYGCQSVSSGTCLSNIHGSDVGFQRNIHPVAGTNFVPRMSVGGELSILMPIINAPFRLFYAYNPLRLYDTPYCNSVLGGGKQSSCSAELITRSMFPAGGAGDYTYAQAIQAYGAQYTFREPRKTFRLTISTTF
jgi:outer membrane protein insertion porin family